MSELETALEAAARAVYALGDHLHSWDLTSETVRTEYRLAIRGALGASSQDAAPAAPSDEMVDAVAEKLMTTWGAELSDEGAYDAACRDIRVVLEAFHLASAPPADAAPGLRAALRVCLDRLREYGAPEHDVAVAAALDALEDQRSFAEIRGAALGAPRSGTEEA